MTNGQITVDDRDVIIALNNLSFKKMNSAYTKAMKKTLDPILKQTKVNLRKSGIKNVNKPYVSKKTGRSFKSMVQGVATSIDMRNDDDAYGKVHIMKEFRLKWFEKGTQIRKTKKGYNRGAIQPKWYFRDAVMQKGKQAQDTLEENIRESIYNAYNRK